MMALLTVMEGMNLRIKILQGNCLDRLKDLEDQSINTCITSPPYWGLRDYGTTEWEGGDENCDHVEPRQIRGKNSEKQSTNNHGEGGSAWKICQKCGAVRKDSQLGLEETPEEFVENLVEVFREVKRVLKDSGTVWLNLGDSYASSGEVGKKDKQKYGGISKVEHLHSGGVKGLPPKNLVGIPWRVAFALQQDGWYLRQDIIWHKPNPMPESVQDRCTKSHEYIFLLSKSPKYYFDNEAIKEDAVSDKDLGILRSRKQAELNHPSIIKRQEIGIDSTNAGDGKKNKRSVWTVTTKPFKEAHFATFPVDLIEPCVLAGCPEKVCVECDTPYERKMEVIEVEPKKHTNISDNRKEFDSLMGGGGTSFKGHSVHFKKDGTPVVTPKKDLGFKKECQCQTNETKAGTVLDPFGGSGTTAEVANKHNRNAVLIELNEEYIEMMKARLVSPQEDMFNSVELEVV